MSSRSAKQLGRYIREQRERQGITLYRLAARTGITAGTFLRIERGDFDTPGPDKLQAIARVLQLPLGDLWAIAGYSLEEDLPSPVPFLRAKYRDLPEAELQALTDDVAHILRAHGIDPHGRPNDHEDEAEDGESAIRLP